MFLTDLEIIDLELEVTDLKCLRNVLDLQVTVKTSGHLDIHYLCFMVHVDKYWNLKNATNCKRNFFSQTVSLQNLVSFNW